MSSSSPTLLAAPRALLLDYGGVLVSPQRHQDGTVRFTQALAERVRARGLHVDEDLLAEDLRIGLATLSAWKGTASRRLRPRELSPETTVSEFLLAGTPAAVRAALSAEAADVLELMSRCHADHPLRTGIVELLQLCDDHGIAVGIVSNAHSARRHRHELDSHGLRGRFAVQIYSEEAGIRKPHPEMITRAAAALGVRPKDCWFVGDTYDRDVRAGRRAGVGTVVLTLDGTPAQGPDEGPEQPDLTLDSPMQLLTALREVLESSAADRTDADPHQQKEQMPQPGPAAAAASVAARSGPGTTGLRRPTLLIDHGGVISRTEKPTEPMHVLAEAVETVLSVGGAPLELEEIRALLLEGHRRYQAGKSESARACDPWQEVTARRYWADYVGPLVDRRRRELLLAEADSLQPILYSSRSRKILREGAADLLRRCAESGIRTVVVSNTLSGRGVRHVLAGHGVDQWLTGAVFSDELGRRKPCPQIFARALEIAEDDGSRCLMLGDKVTNDAWGAQQAGIARRVLTRGGSDSDDELEQALASGVATDLVDHPGQVFELLEAMG